VRGVWGVYFLIAFCSLQKAKNPPRHSSIFCLLITVISIFIFKIK